MRLLIVNADDFGISEGVNRGIVEAHLHGILTSTTVMANMPAFDHAVELKHRHPTLAVGVHLNLTAGKPILPPSSVPDLVDGEGHFLRGDRFLLRLSLGRIDLRQVEAELSAQLERALGAALSPDHLDSHHHVHAHPLLQPMALRIALRHGLEAIRCPVDLGLRGGGSATARLKAVGLSGLGELLRRRARRAGIATPDHFRGLALGMGFSTADLRRLFSELPDGSTELMCHPGYPDRELERQTSYCAGRASELEALLEPTHRQLLEPRGVKLGSYSDISR
ncbi:MAG: carbohydrate deacetylase [Chloroflexota bacterium]